MTPTPKCADCGHRGHTSDGYCIKYACVCDKFRPQKPPVKAGRWKPKIGDKVWTLELNDVDPHGTIIESYYYGSTWYGLQWTFNIFSSRKQAEAARKAIIKILRGE